MGNFTNMRHAATKAFEPIKREVDAGNISPKQLEIWSDGRASMSTIYNLLREEYPPKLDWLAEIWPDLPETLRIESVNAFLRAMNLRVVSVDPPSREELDADRNGIVNDADNRIHASHAVCTAAKQLELLVKDEHGESRAERDQQIFRNCDALRLNVDYIEQTTRVSGPRMVRTG